jgi:hypothetical protein
MTARAELSDNGGTLTVDIPLQIRKRGGRKLMIAPDGTSAWTPPRSRVDSALVKAVARAYRWRRMLDSGAHASITDLATEEKINPSFICRVLRLTLLAPDIVEAILDGRQPSRLQLQALLKPFPADWTTQAALFS